MAQLSSLTERIKAVNAYLDKLDSQVGVSTSGSIRQRIDALIQAVHRIERDIGQIVDDGDSVSPVDTVIGDTAVS